MLTLFPCDITKQSRNPGKLAEMDEMLVTGRVQDLYYKLNYKISKVIVTHLLVGSQTKPYPNCGSFPFKAGGS